MTDTGSRVGFVLPDPTGNPSGGHTYNERILHEWAIAGHPAEPRTVAGAWPHPDEAARNRVAAALRAHPTSLVDGLVGACCPQQIQDATSLGHRVVLLIHLPLADETGLTNAQARDLEGLESWAAHAASAVAATSGTAAHDVSRRHGLPHVAAVPPGADRQEVARGSARVGAGVPRLAVLASVTPRKNQLGFVAALAELADRPWTAEFVGPQPDPAYLAAVRERARDLGIAERIAIPGVLADTDLGAFWDRMDLLVLPSLHETFGLVVTEALAHGIPAVVSRGTGAVEALTGTAYAASADPTLVPPPPSALGDGGLAGAVVDPRSPQDMAEVVGAWLDDPALRASWRECALQRRDHLRPWSDPANELWAVVAGPAAPNP